MPDRVPSAAEVKEALAELQSWPEIARSPQLARFLTYIVEKKLDGEEAAIKAYAIAVDVLGRPTSFDPQVDPIVRVQARRLRALLDQFQAEGRPKAAARITLPVGRYVPQFVLADAEEPAEPAVVPPPAAVARRAAMRAPAGSDARSGQGMRIVIGALAVVVLVGLAIAGNWAAQNLAGRRQAADALPHMPRVFVSDFSNLTGSARYDTIGTALRAGVSVALKRFDILEILNAEGQSQPARQGDFLVSGVVRSVERGLEITTLVSLQGDQRETQAPIVWSVRSVEPFPDGDLGPAVREAATTIASQLGAFRGPLHAPGLSWLAEQTSLPAEPNVYVCQLQYQLIWELQRSKDVVAGLACLDSVLEREPDDPVTLAALGVLEAGVVAVQAAPGEAIAVLVTDAMSRVLRAGALRPESSFVREQQAHILVLQRNMAAARTALDQALVLNPANQVARATLGMVEALSGTGDFGVGDAQMAITSVPRAPPWFRLPLAVDALKHRQFKRALELADILNQGESELAQVLALAAAGGTGDPALIAPRRSAVLVNERLRRSGIGTRMSALITDPALLKTINDGLLAAGVSQAAIDRAF